MKEIIFNDEVYELVKNYRDGFNYEDIAEKVTDYFKDFDYIFGDWAYGKVRLKGFYKEDNKNVRNMNNIKNLDKYIKDNCAYDCRYFLLEKVKKDK